MELLITKKVKTIFNQNSSPPPHIYIGLPLNFFFKFKCSIVVFYFVQLLLNVPQSGVQTKKTLKRDLALIKHNSKFLNGFNDDGGYRDRLFLSVTMFTEF